MTTPSFTDNFERISSSLANANRQETVAIISSELAALDATVRALQAQVNALRAVTELYPALRSVQDAAQSTVALPKTYSVDATELLLPGNGFYHLEYSENGRPYRWTGPRNTFTFTMWVDRTSPLRLTLAIFGFANDHCETLDAVVDGRRFRTAPAPSGYAIDEIPPRDEPGLTTIIFEVPAMRVPKPEEADQRVLGVSFHRLDVAPAS